MDELDSAWLAAEPVTYPDLKPQIYTADGWAEIMSHRQDIAVQSILHAATYTKSPDWKYESEWRLASFKRPEDTDYKFDRREFAAVYFGPMISLEARQSLKLVASAFPNARLWDVSIGMSREFKFQSCADV